MRKALIICLLIPLAVGGLAAWLTMDSMAQFAALAQPPLSPPGWVFPVVWTILYLLMGWASFLIWKLGAPQAAKKRALGLYGFALIWLVILLVLVAETMLAFGRIDRRAAWLLAPYLLWLLFAAYLNAGVWLLNR